MFKTNLPKLLYIGDVPVEASYHGSALLYRLLQNYPPKMLRVIEGNLRSSLPERRLLGVEYRRMYVGRRRWLNTRFYSWVSSWLTRTAGLRARQLPALLGGFAPEAVLTVAHEYSWITAAVYAARCNLPLHLVLHDDWPRIAKLVDPTQSWLDREFGHTYRSAVSRLCVSPFMVEEYRRRYGSGGTVLYPSRAKCATISKAPPSRLKNPVDHLTGVFAGTINSLGYVSALRRLAAVLAPIEGRLHIFGPTTQEQAEMYGLKLSNVELRGLVSSEDLIRRCGEEADFLFVPMSFVPEDRANMEISFPSKLADYTAMGLPLLIYGSSYCSAVRWARENPGVAEVVTDESEESISAALERLCQPAYRLALGEAALRRGEEFFSHAAAEKTFFRALSRNLPSAESKVRPIEAPLRPANNS